MEQSDYALRTVGAKCCRRYQLSPNDYEDVSQVVWLRLVEHVGRIRTPGALPGWIVVTTKYEVLRVVTSQRRTDLVDPLNGSGLYGSSPDRGVEGELLRVELSQAVRDGLAELEPGHRELLLFLHADRKVTYRDASDQLGMPVGSIGPTRARCPRKLLKTSAVRRLVQAERV